MIKVIQGAELEDLKDTASKAAFGLSRSAALSAGLCIACKRAVKKANGEFRSDMFHSDAGRREWSISGLCESCFDAMFDDENDGEDLASGPEDLRE